MHEINFPPDDVINKLGYPIPNGDIHDVSVVLPKARQVADLEEQEPAVLEQIKTAYPRLFEHPLYRELCDKIRSDWNIERKFAVTAFPSISAAAQCVSYAKVGEIKPYKRIAVVIAPYSRMSPISEFRRHAGLMVSSREAEDILRDRHQSHDDEIARDLRSRIGALYNTSPDNVLDFRTGMAAVYAAYKIVTAQTSRTIQLGFPYVDTWKLQERFGQGSVYVPYNSPQDLANFSAALAKQRTAAVFCEIPGNPLLRTIDLPLLKNILNGTPLVVDDTLGPPMNLNVKSYADIIVTSATKYASGSGKAMGGWLVLNEGSPHFGAFKSALHALTSERLYAPDGQIILDGLRDFPERMKVINANTEDLYHALKNNSAIDVVHYPKGDPVYESMKLPAGGYGGLLSLTLKDPEQTPEFYDRLRVFKGPSLGMNVTLTCLYTWLAHWHELDWAREQGVPKNLVRVSVGLENPRETVARFEEALQPSATKKHVSLKIHQVS